MKFPAPEHRLFRAAMKADPIVLQNTLLRIPDVELALLLSDVPEDQAGAILDSAGPAKKQRVLLEVLRLMRVKITGKDVLSLQQDFLDRLKGRTIGQTRHFFRPLRKPGRE